MTEVAVSKYRPIEFHYYDWDFNRWFGSETRARCRVLPGDYPMGLLSNAAEGAYRNLLDYCYQEGDIPADLGGLSALCGMTPDTFEMVWPAFRSKFKVHKSRPGRLVHDEVSIRRLKWRKKKLSATEAGEKSASKTRIDKLHAINGLDNERTATAKQGFPSAHQEVVSSVVVKKKEEESNGAERSLPNRLPSNAEDWAQRLYERHPKKKNKVLAEQEVCKVWVLSSTPQALFEQIDSVHEWLSSTADWKKKNGMFAPQLAEWLADEGWKVKNPESHQEIGPYIPSWEKEDNA